MAKGPKPEKRSRAEVVKEIAEMQKMLDKGKYQDVINQGWDFAADWKVVETTPMTTLFWKCMGLAYFHIKDFDGATKCFENALIILPDDEEAMICRGMTSLATANIDGAIKDFESALKVNQNDARAYVLASLCYGLRGDKVKSKTYAQKAAKKDVEEAVKISTIAIDAVYNGPNLTDSQRLELMKAKTDLKKMVAFKKKD